MTNKQNLKEKLNNLPNRPEFKEIKQATKIMKELTENLRRISASVDFKQWGGLAKKINSYNDRFKELSKVFFPPKISHFELPPSPQKILIHYAEELLDSNKQFINKLSEGNQKLVREIFRANRLNKILIGITIFSVVVLIISFFIR